jgi:hypothetical protein
MKIVVSALHFEWQSIEECLTRASEEFNLDGVELSFDESCEFPHCTRSHIDTLAAMRDTNPLNLSAHIWIDLARVDADKAGQTLKFCFDTGHGNMTRNSGELLRELAPWLNYVHLADNGGVDDDHQMFRHGSVDWDGVFAALMAVKFDGIFCVEFPMREDLQPFRACAREIRSRWT